MRKFITLTAALVMSICFAVTAQANVVNNYGAYKGNFTGQEVVFTSDGDLVTDPADLAQVGLQMYALAVISTINTTKSASSSGEVNYPPVFTSRNGGGTYFATLSGFSASKVGDVVQEGTRIVQDVFFTGGTLNWYYSEDDSLNDVLQWMRYDSTVGDYAHYGTVLGDILPDPFLVADIVSNDPEYTGKVTVEMDMYGNVMRTDFTFYANVQEGYEFWQSGAYGNDNGGTGFDMEFGGKLVWGDGRFYTNDGNFRVAAPTPEPSSIILMSLGLLFTAAFVRRQQKNK